MMTPMSVWPRCSSSPRRDGSLAVPGKEVLDQGHFGSILPVGVF